MTCKLRLYFSHNPFELYRTEFFNAEADESCISVRGNCAGAYQNVGTFQWSYALSAVSILALETVLNSNNGIIEGDLGSPAASLSFCLSRYSRWLEEMFGHTRSGEVFARKLFRVTNSQCKRPGPVAVAFNSKILKPSDIEVLDKNGDPASNLLKKEILFSLRSQWKRKAPTTRDDKRLVKNGLSKIEEIFEQELRQTLLMTDVFEDMYLRRQFNDLLKDSTFWGFSDAGLKLDALYQRMRPLYQDSTLSGNGAIMFHEDEFEIAVQPSFFSSIAIFALINSDWRAKLKVNCNFLHSKDVLDKISTGALQREPDAMIVSLAAAVKDGLFSDDPPIEYTPLTIMPQSTHQVIALRSGRAKTRRLSFGNYRFMCESPGTGMVYFNELNKMGLVNRKRVNLFHTEPYELATLIGSGDDSTRAISWFPHYNFHVYFNNCMVLDGLKNSLAHQGSVLLVANKHLDSRRPEALLKLIKYAWNKLKGDYHTRKKIVSEILCNHTYKHTVFRGSGLDTFLLSNSKQGEVLIANSQ